MVTPADPAEGVPLSILPPQALQPYIARVYTVIARSPVSSTVSSIGIENDQYVQPRLPW